jgi:hypothetical protein
MVSLLTLTERRSVTMMPSLFVVPPGEHLLGWQPIWSPDETQLRVFTWVPGDSVCQSTFWLNVVSVPAVRMSLAKEAHLWHSRRTH